MSFLTAAARTLAWRPFLEPLDLHDHWWLTLLPLALGVSIAYRAVRVTSFNHYWRQTLVMCVQVVGGMILLAALVFTIIELVIPLFE